MKRKALIVSVAGLVLVGGAFGAGAFADDNVQETGLGSSTENKMISIEKAEEIAVKEVNGNIESVELEKEDGMLKYEVELHGEDGDDDIDVKVDAVSGDVIKVERDDDDKRVKVDTVSADLIKRDNNDDTKKVVKREMKITKDEAIAIATKDTPGKVVDVEYDDGEYEIEIKTDKSEVEFEIDARSGRILEKEIDNDNDDDNDQDDDDDRNE